MKNAPKHILVGEDDPGIIEVVTILLKESGYIPHAASSKNEIIGICKKNQIDMIFLDILLHGESGKEIAIALKSDPKLAKIPLIMLSANMELKQIAKASGADGYLSKPFDIDDFLGIIKKYLGN